MKPPTEADRGAPDTTRPPHAAGAGLRGAIAYERIKLQTVRSTWWSLLLGALLMAAIGVIIGMSMKASGDNGFDVTRPAPHAATDGFLLAQLPLIVVATLAITSEYATGSIRPTLLSVPVRGRMLLAKLLAVTVVTAVWGAVLCLVGTAAVAPFADGYGEFTAAELGTTALASSLYVALLGTLTLGLGTLTRSAAATITTITMLLLAVPQILRVSTVDWLEAASDYLPDTAGAVLMTQADDPYGVPVAAPVLLAWAVAAFLAGYHRLRFQDA
jgi:ABC-2 type transport system permease protein